MTLWPSQRTGEKCWPLHSTNSSFLTARGYPRAPFDNSVPLRVGVGGAWGGSHPPPPPAPRRSHVRAHTHTHTHRGWRRLQPRTSPARFF